jgi:hypothetical protein
MLTLEYVYETVKKHKWFNEYLPLEMSVTRFYLLSSLNQLVPSIGRPSCVVFSSFTLADQDPLFNEAVDLFGNDISLGKWSV